MADFEVWHVVKVPFPYTNRPTRQYRPALIAGPARLEGAPSLLWVLMITSEANRRWPGDVVISGLTEAGLPTPSIVRCAKIATVEASSAKVLGRLPERDRPSVRDWVRHICSEGSKRSSS